MVDPMKIFSDLDECIDFLTDSDVSDEQFFLILSESFGESFVPLIHSIAQLHSIYIHGSDGAKKLPWVETFEKIRGQVWDDLQCIYEHFKVQTSQSADEFVAISFLSPSELTNTDHQDLSFMYTKLLKEVLLNTYDTDTEVQARRQMLAFCRKYCMGNESELQLVNEFENKFEPGRSIYWYTRECFLHKILNKALWIPEPHILYQLRYFLRHLDQFIQDVAFVQSVFQKSITVYRGQGLPVEAFEKLKNGIGGLLSFRSFLSTSLNRNVAFQYAEPFKYIPNQISVIFMINIDSKIEKCHFVNVGGMSYYEGAEEEILFTIGAIFRVDAVDKLSDQQWQVQLSSTSDISMNLAQNTEQAREIIRSNHPLIGLVKLVNVTGQYKMIDELANIFTENDFAVNDPHLLIQMQYALGSAYLSTGNQTDALKFLQGALNTHSKYSLSAELGLSSIYNRIGNVHHVNNNYEMALENYKLALDCQVKSSSQDFNSSSMYAKNISIIYKSLGNDDAASEYEKRSLEYVQQHQDNNRMTTTNLHNSTKDTSRKNVQYSESAKYNGKTSINRNSGVDTNIFSTMNRLVSSGQMNNVLQPYMSPLESLLYSFNLHMQRSLPGSLSSGNPYTDMARTHCQLHKFDEAISCYQKALELDLQNLADDDPTIARSYYNLSTTYVAVSQYNEALQYAHKALAQLQKRSNFNPSELSKYTCHIGTILDKQKKYSEAIKYFKESLNIKLTDINNSNESLADDYKLIAGAYENLKNYVEALSFYEKALEIQRCALDNDDSSIPVTHYRISKVYLYMSRYHEALKHAHIALEKYRRCSNQDEASLGWLIFQVAEVLHAQEKDTEAICYYQEALTILVACLSSDDGQLAGIYYRIADVYFALGNFADALTFYKNTLDVELMTLTGIEPAIAVTYERLAETLVCLNRLDEATDYYVKSIEQLLKTCPPHHRDILRLQMRMETAMSR